MAYFGVIHCVAPVDRAYHHYPVSVTHVDRQLWCKWAHIHCDMNEVLVYYTKRQGQIRWLDLRIKFIFE